MSWRHQGSMRAQNWRHCHAGTGKNGLIESQDWIPSVPSRLQNNINKRSVLLTAVRTSAPLSTESKKHSNPSYSSSGWTPNSNRNEYRKQKGKVRSNKMSFTYKALDGAAVFYKSCWSVNNCFSVECSPRCRVYLSCLSNLTRCGTLHQSSLRLTSKYTIWIVLCKYIS